MVDLDDQAIILFNYANSELSNPTIVMNSFSKTITLKGTANNNRIFGNIYRSDRVTQYDGLVGMNFDPAKKTPFYIMNETNSILESGYMRLDGIRREGRLIEYDITLYGGLGSFLYGLMYNADGSKRTLKDLKYMDRLGQKRSDFSITPDAGCVNEAWEYLADPAGFDVNNRYYPFWNIINFAPAYNGLPDSFDATKALVKRRSVYVNIPIDEDVDGVTYSTKSDATTELLTFSNPHTEWEICDLRWYLQRPVLSIVAFFDAICDSDNNGGYEVELDSTFFGYTNPAYHEGWLTLQMIAAENRESTDCLNAILGNSITPADILLSFAKTYGLMFLFDSEERKVSILPRSAFYQSNDVIDLTRRINLSSPVEIEPLVADSLYYQLGDKVIGQFAEDYRKDFQKEFAIQRINTGYEFDSKTEILTKDIHFKDAVEVLEKSRMFTSGGFTRYGELAYAQNFLLPAYEGVTIQLWAAVDGEDVSADVDVTATAKNFVMDNASIEFADWLPKVQLHKDNKAEDGSYVMLFFSGIKSTPAYQGSVVKKYWLSNDHVDMVTLNNDSPCWNLTGDETALTSLPSFRRYMTADDGVTIEASFEWGNPLARGVPGLLGNKTIYEKWWRKYLTDLYDDDTRVMRCKVNLRGLAVTQSLLRRFFWYDGAIWRLNKIENHSLTTWDDTECEFVKVQDINNYIG